jgi:protocatechuate 3,4-dioxygenase beta subunit
VASIAAASRIRRRHARGPNATGGTREHLGVDPRPAPTGVTIPALDRRAFIGLGAGALGALVLSACSSGGSGTDRAASTTTTTVSGAVAVPPLTPADFGAAATCRPLPEKTAGPFPLDRQLDRRVITENSSGRPLRLGLRVVDERCRPIGGAAVEVWHCDATGDYSAFADGNGGKDAGPGTTFLRGTQTAGDDGIVEFTSIYPGWYRGRAVHVHLRVHRDDRTVLTSQLFFPDAYTDAVYASAPYARFGLPDTRNAQDSIAGDPAAEGTLATVRDAVTENGPGTLALLNVGLAN